MARGINMLCLFVLSACAAADATSPANAPSAGPFDSEGGPDAFHGETVFDGGYGDSLDYGEASAFDVLDDDVGDSSVADDGGGIAEPKAPAGPQPHPLAQFSDAQLSDMLKADPSALGSISLGTPNHGALRNPVKMPQDPRWQIMDPPNSYGTKETVGFIIRCVEVVHKLHPGTPKLHIGDLSRRRGGHLRPHVSHQSGRDVDLGFFYTKESRWYARGTADNLDLPRMWTFIKALITETDVHLILVDRRIQKMLISHAHKIGENDAWLKSVFKGAPGAPSIIRHARGHATHLHVRFFNPIAQVTGGRAYPLMIKHKILDPPTFYIRHRARKGDTLAKMARRYRTTVKAIRRANRLRSNRIRERRVYKVPRRGGAVPKAGPVVIPPRRLPPVQGATKSPAPDNAEVGVSPEAEPLPTGKGPVE